MAPMCRMCGPKASAGDLTTKLSTEVNNVSLRFLFTMFTHVKFDDNPLLPQAICDTCRITLFEFIEFSRCVEEMQVELKKLPFKSEAGKGCGFVIQEVISGDCYERPDSPIAVEESETLYNDAESTPTSPSVRETIKDYKLQRCSVVLERLPLIYVPSDSETDSASESEDKPSSKKRGLDSSYEKSPNKRMRLGPLSPSSKAAEDKPHRPINFSSQMRPKPEAAEKRATIIVTQDMQQYEDLFKIELTEDIHQSQHNLSVPETAKQSDGELKEDYAELFTSWSAIKVKCAYKSCNKKFEPYQMKQHLRDHHGTNDGVFKCSLTGCSEELTFVKFCQHVVEKHHNYMSYRCVLCSRMYFNYAALCRHYRSAHHDFNDFQICLQDGHFFETLGKLEDHLAKHRNAATHSARAKKRVSRNNNDLKESQENVPKGNSANVCDICQKTFSLPFDLQWHKMAHTEEQNFIH